MSNVMEADTTADISEIVSKRSGDEEDSTTSLRQFKSQNNKSVKDVKNAAKYKLFLNALPKINEALLEMQTKVINNLQKERKKLLYKSNEMIDERSKVETEIEDIRKEYKSEVIAVRAQLKKSEMRIQMLKTLLDHKTKENEELNQMVDELITKLDRHSSLSD